MNVRWAESSDAALPIVADHVPPAVVSSRIAERRIALAELDGQPVGALHLDYLWGTKPYIALIRAEETHQRRGVGSALLEFVASSLRDAGHSQLLSSSQLNEPEPQAWHRRMGFTECGVLKGINSDGVGEMFFLKSLLP